MKNSTLIKTALIAASLPLLAGCVEREVVYRDRPAPSGDVVVEDPAPPPPQVEVIPVAPGPLDVWFWAPGSWEWRGRWVWFGGHWGARPHPGAVWVHSGWGHRGHGRVWVGAHWR
jgi:hypothetical protein